MKKTIILENGSREEACRRFDSIKQSITDFTKESVSIKGNIRNHKEGWKVIKINY
jgi:hypothetical protein